MYLSQKKGRESTVDLKKGNVDHYNINFVLYLMVCFSFFDIYIHIDNEIIFSINCYK